MDRRRFIKEAGLAAAGLGAPFARALRGPAEEEKTGSLTKEQSIGSEDAAAVDTNVHLLCYPFRDLKHGATDDLVGKLRQHNVRQAWAGSFTALFHKNIDHVNASLSRECREKGEGMLVPFGTVNPAFPDWEEDLRRCNEEYRMPGIRLYPGYHGYTLDEKHFLSLLQQARERDLLVQIVIAMEDERMQHPLAEVPNTDVTPLPGVLAQVPGLQVQLLHPFRHVRGDRLRAMVDRTDVTFEISNLDGVAAIERIMNGNHWYMPDIVIPPERLLFGSHMPYFPLENALFKFMESPMSEEQARSIMSRNAERLMSVAGARSYRMPDR